MPLNLSDTEGRVCSRLANKLVQMIEASGGGIFDPNAEGRLPCLKALRNPFTDADREFIELFFPNQGIEIGIMEYEFPLVTLVKYERYCSGALGIRDIWHFALESYGDAEDNDYVFDDNWMFQYGGEEKWNLSVIVNKFNELANFT